MLSLGSCFCNVCRALSESVFMIMLLLMFIFACCSASRIATSSVCRVEAPSEILLMISSPFVIAADPALFVI